jgi:type II secretory pathway pseudopilin PulG
MTLVEILITLSIIVLLAAIFVPVVKTAMERRQNSLCASRMRIAVNAFELYRSENGGYPADKNPAQIPPEMTDYFEDLGITGWWTQNTPVGGRWDWDNGYHYAYSVSVSAPSAPVPQLEKLDALLDDGNLNTGTFRKNGTQYHYILEE